MTDGTMLIRQATLVDVPRLAEMGEAFAALSPYEVDYDREACEGVLASQIQGGGVFVAEYAGEVCGAIGGISAPIWYAPKGSSVVLELFWWVNPEHRGSTAGVKLVAELCKWARKVGACSVVMSCLETSPPATAEMLQRLGFARTEQAFTRGV